MALAGAVGPLVDAPSGIVFPRQGPQGRQDARQRGRKRFQRSLRKTAAGSSVLPDLGASDFYCLPARSIPAVRPFYSG